MLTITEKTAAALSLFRDPVLKSMSHEDVGKYAADQIALAARESGIAKSARLNALAEVLKAGESGVAMDAESVAIPLFEALGLEVTTVVVPDKPAGDTMSKSAAPRAVSYTDDEDEDDAIELGAGRAVAADAGDFSRDLNS